MRHPQDERDLCCFLCCGPEGSDSDLEPVQTGLWMLRVEACLRPPELQTTRELPGPKHPPTPIHVSLAAVIR
ncbi:hypothetical protein LDENG_00134900 [Lucifuga dentata]|nr:hypothetical protein LDENG_00134900 [Lucifuga dentata]